MLVDIAIASLADLDAITALDTAVFDKGDPDLEPAVDGELLAGVESQQLIVARDQDRIVGFLQYDVIGARQARGTSPTEARYTREPSNIDIISLAVDPSAQQQGVGQQLLSWFLERILPFHEGKTLTSVTSPSNTGMLTLLLSNGFVVARAIPDYFGEGKDRFYCQYDYRAQALSAEAQTLVPVAARAYIFELIKQDNYVITGLLRGAQGDFFEVSRVEPEDRAGLMGNEASISVSEAGTVLSGFTFLLGISFVIPEFSVALRVMILIATIVTTGALAIFANSSGNLARIRDDAFDKHMSWANVLLEFGGLYPLAIVLSAVFVHDDSSFGLSIVVSIVVALLLAGYEFSPFSLGRRYKPTVPSQTARWATVALPLLSGPLFFATGGETVWVAVVAVVLVGRSTIHLAGRNKEVAWTPMPRKRLFARRTHTR